MLTKTDYNIDSISDYMHYVPFEVPRLTLYTPQELYKGYDYKSPCTQNTCYDTLVYQHYIETGKHTFSAKEMLARSLHDFSISHALDNFMLNYNPRSVVGIMGGHGMKRSDKRFREIVLISKSLTENGHLMVSGGGPGAMEATHLGAWLAGRDISDVDEALQILKEANDFSCSNWLSTAFEVIEKFPQDKYHSLGIPTWLYGHEPATPFATNIAKYFDNSIREDGILTIAFGGIIFTPGSAGTLQEIFQEAVQNHYLSFGYASPMIFFDKHFWTKEVPIYPLLRTLMHTGKYKNLLLSATDEPSEIISILQQFRDNA